MKPRATAFTLVELIVVVAIISILLVAGTPYVASTLEANKLTSIGVNLSGKLSQGQQLCVSENRPVEMRFFTYENNGSVNFRACQLFFYNSKDDTSKAIEGPVFFGDGSIIADPDLSPLLQAENQSGIGWPKVVNEEPFKSKDAKYVRVIFYPDGATNIAVPLNQSYITLIGEGKKTGSSSAPSNYFTIQIDPVTGRSKTYRP